MARRFLVLAAMGVFCVLAGCAHLGRSVEAPSVRLVNVMPTGMSLFEQRLTLVLRVTNPNPFALSWTGCKVNARLNDMAMLPAVSKENGSVEELGETEIRVETAVSTFDVVRQVMGLQAGGGKLSYALEGVFFLSGFRAGDAPFATTGMLWDSGGVK